MALRKSALGWSTTSQMRKAVAYISFMLLVCLSANAQTGKELRDSLSLVSSQLQKTPESIDLRLRKAGLNLRLEQWDYACAEYDKVLWLDPDNVSALYFRAYVYERQGKYAFARKDYKAMLAIVPGNFEAQLGLALLNQKDKHYTEALDQLNILCSQHPDRSEAFAARAGVERERGMNDLAEYDFQQAIRLDPSNADYRISHVDVLITLDRKDDAHKELDNLVKMGVPKPNLEEFYQRTR